MRWYLPVLAVVLTVLSPALADGSGEQGKAPASTNATDNDMNQVICRKMGPPIGSHLGSKTVCQTKKAWMEQDHAVQDTMHQLTKAGSNPGN